VLPSKKKIAVTSKKGLQEQRESGLEDRPSRKVRVGRLVDTSNAKGPHVPERRLWVSTGGKNG